MKSVSNLILVVQVLCHKMQGMMEAFTDTLYSREKRAIQFTKKRYYFTIFSGVRQQINLICYQKKSFRHALYNYLTRSNFEFHDFRKFSMH